MVHPSVYAEYPELRLLDEAMARITTAPTIEAAALAWFQYWLDDGGDPDPYDEYCGHRELFDRIRELR